MCLLTQFEKGLWKLPVDSKEVNSDRSARPIGTRRRVSAGETIAGDLDVAGGTTAAAGTTDGRLGLLIVSRSPTVMVLQLANISTVCADPCQGTKTSARGADRDRQRRVCFRTHTKSRSVEDNMHSSCLNSTSTPNFWVFSQRSAASG